MLDHSIGFFSKVIQIEYLYFYKYTAANSNVTQKCLGFYYTKILHFFFQGAPSKNSFQLYYLPISKFSILPAVGTQKNSLIA
jgi:hypothetical protein